MTAKRKGEKPPADPPKSALELAFEERGVEAIETVRKLAPSAYVSAIARLIRAL